MSRRVQLSLIPKMIFLSLLACCWSGQLSAQGMSLQTLVPVESGVPLVRIFGHSLDREGGLLAVGAPGNLNFNVGSGPAGGVFVYQRQPNASFAFEQFLQAPTPALDDAYGYAVELTPAQMVVGAPFSNTIGPNRGRVYAYTRAGASYGTPKVIDPGLAVNNDALFGSSLAIDAGWLAVGAPRSSTSGLGGQVQLYRFDGDFEIWVYHSSVGLPTASNGALFGSRVLLRGDRLLVGAPQENIGEGWVYEFQRSGAGAGASWGFRQRFRAAGAGANFSYFGESLSLNAAATTLAVGQPGSPGVNGKVFLFERDGSGNWADAGSLMDRPSTVASLAYGRSVVFDGAYLYVGDTSARLSGSPNRPGDVYRFRRGAGISFDLERDHARPGGDGDSYGWALASIGNELAIGAPFVNGVGNNQEGRVYTYVGSNLNEAPALIFDNPISLTQGEQSAPAIPLGTVVDLESPAVTIAVSQQGGGTAAGVGSSGLSIDGDTLRGSLIASCTAASGTLRFVANDGLATSTGDLGINVLPNPPPTLSYGGTTLAFGGSVSVNPATGPSDNGSFGLSVLSTGSFGGSVSVSAAGVVSLGNAGPGGTHTITIRATDDCGAVTDATLQVQVSNTPPVFTPAAAQTRQQGSPAGAAVTVGTVVDAESSPGSLQVSTIPGGTATGISVSNLINMGGTISAELSASCTATSGTVRFQVSDGSASGSGDLQVNVSVNTPPTLAYAPLTVGLGSSGSQSPSAGPSDNGSVGSVSILSQGSYSGTAVVASNGQVSLANAQPLGNHTITIRATDNCGTNRDAALAVTVNGNAPPNFFPTAPVSRQQGTAAGAAVTIGTVTDDDDPVGSLVVTRVAGGSAGGISVSNISNSAGTISAQLAADCGATAGTVRFQVSDGSATGSGDLQLNVGLNDPPSLGNYLDLRLLSGLSAQASPSSAPADNGSLLTPIVAIAPNSYAGSLTISNQAVVSVGGVGPVGTYTIGVQLEDNCGATTQRSFDLEVLDDPLLIDGFESGNG